MKFHYGTKKAKASRLLPVFRTVTHLLLYICGHTPVLYGAHGFPWLCSTRGSLGIPSQQDFSIFFGSSWWGPYRLGRDGLFSPFWRQAILYHAVDRTCHESGFISSPIWNCYCLCTPEALAVAKEHAASYSNYDRNRFHRKHFLDSSILLPCSDPYYQLCFSSGKRESWPFWQSSSRLLSGNVAVFVFFVCS